MSARTRRNRSCVAVGLIGALILAVAACSSDKTTSATTATTATTTSSTQTPAAASKVAVVFGGDGNNLDAYEGVPPFRHQRVNSAFTPEAPQKSDPRGTDINAQICFFPRWLRAVHRRRGQEPDEGRPPGVGIFRLTGTSVGSFRIRETAKLVPTFQSSKDNAENYGCGILSDGRVVTSDVGDEATGAADGQLIVWFPPFNSHHVEYCKIDVAISTAQSILIDRDDHIFLAAARPTSAKGVTGGSEKSRTSIGWGVSGLGRSSTACH